jgi:hypothetical protein
MSTDRVNNKVFKWAFRNAVNKKKIGVSELWQNILIFDKYKVNWQNRMFSQTVGNKLRTSFTFLFS